LSVVEAVRLRALPEHPPHPTPAYPARLCVSECVCVCDFLSSIAAAGRVVVVAT